MLPTCHSATKYQNIGAMLILQWEQLVFRLKSGLFAFGPVIQLNVIILTLLLQTWANPGVKRGFVAVFQGVFVFSPIETPAWAGKRVNKYTNAHSRAIYSFIKLVNHIFVTVQALTTSVAGRLQSNDNR